MTNHASSDHICRTCRFWDRTSQPVIQHLIARVCRANTADEKEIAEHLDRAGGCDNRLILTGPEFGCCHWETME